MGTPRRAAGRRIAALCLAAAGLAVSAAGCGGRSLTAGMVPFPAEKPVFVDGDGRPLRDLPPAAEPVRLVVLDYPWCPPCADAWKAVGTAAGTLPPGSVRVYRILFDRERYFTREGVGVVPPLEAAGDRGAPGAASPAFAVTTLTAIPDAFRKEYEVGQAPVVLLLGGRGKVARRWTGYSASLAESLVEEIRRPAANQDASVSPPP